MIIQDTNCMDNTTVLFHYNQLRIQEAELYYEITEKRNCSTSLDSQRADVDKLHSLRCEASRLRNILLKRGIRNI
jgi:CHAD domain-containing protein